MIWSGCKEFPFGRAICTSAAALAPVLGFASVRSAQAALLTSPLSAKPASNAGNLFELVIFLVLIATIVSLFLLLRKRRQDLHEERFRDCFQQALIGIAFEDMSGKLLQVNPKLCSMLGYSEAELLSMRCDKFLNPEGADELNEVQLFDDLRSGRRDHYLIEKTYRRKDGTKIWGRVHVCKLNVKGNSEPLVVAMVEDITDRKEAEHRLNNAELRLHDLTGRLIQAQEEERRRIARELHDDIGQRLSLLMLQLEHIKRALSATSAGQMTVLDKAMLEADELTRDVHELSHQLHSTKLSYIGLKAALRELCEQIALQQDMKITQHLEDDTDLPSDVQLCFYRVAQEALSNVAKHSQAASASVCFVANGGLARLEIADTGIGFDVSASGAGLGLASMRERVRTVRGELAVTSNPGKGTRVVAVIPYDNTEALSRAA
jgi:PAS domain S-box-containing protein